MVFCGSPSRLRQRRLGVSVRKNGEAALTNRRQVLVPEMKAALLPSHITGCCWLSGALLHAVPSRDNTEEGAVSKCHHCQAVSRTRRITHHSLEFQPGHGAALTNSTIKASHKAPPNIFRGRKCNSTTCQGDRVPGGVGESPKAHPIIPASDGLGWVPAPPHQPLAVSATLLPWAPLPADYGRHHRAWNSSWDEETLSKQPLTILPPSRAAPSSIWSNFFHSLIIQDKMLRCL